MDSLRVLSETFTNGYQVGILSVISIVSVLCGIFVIISKNPIVSVLFLIGLFLSIASYLIVLGMSFIGLSYLLVYVGAVSILFLFILMLINVRISELHSETSNSIPLAVIIAVCFNIPLHETLPYGWAVYNNYNTTLNGAFKNVFSNNYQGYNVKGLLNTDDSNSGVVFVTSNSWDGNLAETSQITSIGSIMYTSYSVWLIITSFVLLLAMVGAIVITIEQKN